MPRPEFLEVAELDVAMTGRVKELTGGEQHLQSTIPESLKGAVLARLLAK